MRVMRLLSSLHHNEDERQIFLLSRTLIKQGHVSMVIASTDPSHELAVRLKREGSQYEQVYLEKSSWISLLSMFRLASLIRRFRPDIVHIHSRTPAWILKWALQFVPEAYRPVTVATIYGYYPITAYNKAIFDADHLISVSDSVTHHIKTHHREYNDSNITRIYRGIDKQRAIYRHNPSVYWLRQIFAEYPELEHKKWLLFPNRIDFDKGQQWLFDIVGNLKDSFPKIQIIIMDDENNENLYFEQFVQRVNALNLGAYFTFIGIRYDTKEWLAAANIVLGLTNEPESIGINVLKAVHLGTPVVAWERGIYSEFLQELYPQGLVKQINANALCKAISNHLLNVCRPKISDKFTAEQTVSQVIALYQKLVDESPSIVAPTIVLADDDTTSKATAKP